MNEKALKFRIGLFLLAATCLLVGSLFFFGLTNLFQQNVRLVSFFSESVRGLDTGSVVRFRGVKVGEVKAVKLQLDNASTIKGTPVIYEINLTHMRDKLGVDLLSRDLGEIYKEAIAKGLCANLETESLVTGQLSIDLDNHPEYRGKPVILDGNLHVIPTSPSLLSNFTEKAMQIANELSQIDFSGLSTNLNKLLVQVDQDLRNLDTNQIGLNLNKTLVTLNQSLTEIDLPALSNSLAKTTEDLSDLIAFVQKEGEALSPELKESIQRINATLKLVDDTLSDARDSLASPTGPVASIDETLRDVRDTFQALRSFVEFIRRNPNALLFGRENP